MSPALLPSRIVGLSPGLSAPSEPGYVLGSALTRASLPSPAFSGKQLSVTGVTDVDVVWGMARGEEQAATQLYERHGAAMYGLALRVVRDPADAEEVVLDAFAQAWRDAARYDGTRGSVLGWLTTITRTRALDCVRARGRRERMTATAALVPDEPVAMGKGHAPPDAQVGEGETAAVVQHALQRLPDAQRTAIELAFYEGLTHLEVAERLQQPLGTVKTRIRQGLLKLRETLGGMASEPLT